MPFDEIFGENSKYNRGYVNKQRFGLGIAIFLVLMNCMFLGFCCKNYAI